MRLYRPVGIHELALIFDSEMAAFPPRLPEQPIFYPVLHVLYAIQIARDWNAKGPNGAGYVSEFDVEDEYARRFEPHIVGAREHEELWVPAEELAEFNRHIVGKIRVIEAYFGEGFTGYVPDDAKDADPVVWGKDAVQQFVAIEPYAFPSGGFDLYCITWNDRKPIFLHFPFWVQHDFTAEGISNEERYWALAGFARMWTLHLPEIALCYADYV